MFNRFLPKKSKFFDLLSELVGHVLDSAKLFQEMYVKNENIAEYSSQIHIIENVCDDLTHKIINELNENFITPIDREDIHALVNRLDDIIDTIDTTALRTKMYKLKTPLAYSKQLSDILLIQTTVLADVINQIHDAKQTTEKIVQVRHLETEGDVLFREAIVSLFDTETDVVELIKKKELLENIEKAVDKCQNAATVVEGILIKNL